MQSLTPAASRSRKMRLAAGLVLGLAALALAGIVSDEALSSAARSLSGVLLLLHAGAAGALAMAGVAVAGLALEGLITLELLHKAALAGMVAGPLAFAQQTGASQPTPDAPADAETRAARSEIQLGLYGGGNGVFDADVRLKQPNGTDMTLKDVRWRGQPFDMPPYYGYRATYWPAKAPSLGIMLEFVHAKAISRRHEAVEQTGTRDGEPVPPREPVSATFTKLEYSHGLNFLMVNAVYRFRGLHRRILPYFGAGLGIMVPHSEAARKGVARADWSYRYEISGPGVQALAGIEWRAKPDSRFQPFTELKLGYSRNSTDLHQGGWVKANLWAYQVAVGLSAYLRPPLPVGPVL